MTEKSKERIMDDLDKQEVEILIKEIYAVYGYDFSGYSKASFHRRIHSFQAKKSFPDLVLLRKILLSDSLLFETFLREITVNVTEMFRDPSFFQTLRKKVLPQLSTYPYLKIWDAGCSTGEELISLSILLKEEDLLHKCKIYATDINQKVLHQAKEGVYPLNYLPQFTRNYQMAGGKASLSDYYTAKYERAIFDNSLLQNVVFYPHNLATDASFNEFHLIICRNVLIYFTKELQEKVFSLFDQSLCNFGYLGLGKKESLYLSTFAKKFELIDKEDKVYKKTGM